MPVGKLTDEDTKPKAQLSFSFYHFESLKIFDGEVDNEKYTKFSLSFGDTVQIGTFYPISSNNAFSILPMNTHMRETQL